MTAPNPCHIRSATNSVHRPRIDRAARVVHDVAVATRGEALGHDLWVDPDFLGQLATAINGTQDGIPSRDSHFGSEPIGCIRNARIVNGTCRADLYVEPDDTGDYVLRLAQDDPAALGLSAAFARDTAAEEEFTAAHTDPESGDFRSPDDANVNQFSHVRLRELWAVDVVNEAAACPAGLFSRRDPKDADTWEALLQYIFGLASDAPADSPLSIHPERIKQFADRFLDRHSLAIRRKDQAVKRSTPAAKREHRLAPLLRRLRAVNDGLRRRMAAEELGTRLPPLNPCRVKRA